MPQSKKPSIFLLYSAIAAGFMIGFTLVTWRGGPVAFIGRAGYIKYVLVIGIALIAGIVVRKQNEGYLEFRQALKVIFGVMVVGMAVQTLSAWLLLSIDTKFKQSLMPFVVAQMEATYRGQYSEDEVARNVAQLKTYDPFSFWNMLGGLARIYIILFLVSVGMAAAVGQRKKVSVGPKAQN
jgi:hypothetical protein